MHKHIKEIKQMTALLEKGYPIEGMVQYKNCYVNTWQNSSVFPIWNEECEYRVALERVEDKYVFEGDALYDLDDGQ